MIGILTSVASARKELKPFKSSRLKWAFNILRYNHGKTSVSKSWFKFQESLMTSRKEGDPDNSRLSTRFYTLSGKPGELTAHF